MTQKTWFLPPNFSFLPDGELALGTVIQYPSRPTLALASLRPDSHPQIVLPRINSFPEPNHSHSTGSSKSIGGELFAKFIDLASASGKIDASHYKNRSFGPVDLEVRSFGSSIPPESLQAIAALDKVKKYVNGGRFGKRPVYIISGLRVAKDSFRVTNEVGSTTSAALQASGAAPAGPVPLEAGGGISGSREKTRTDGYDTTPGIIFAYRLHVIRSKRDGDTESELFSHKTAFHTGEGDDEEDEMEFVEVTGEVINDDLDVEPNFDEYPVGAESYIVFRGE